MRIPKKVRKLDINGEVWGWKIHGFFSSIWHPDGKRVEVRTTEFGVGWDEDYGIQGTVYPGDVRRYIEDNLTEEEFDFTPDETAVPGKLYIYRYNKPDEGPKLKLISAKGGDYEQWERVNMMLDFLAKKQPVFLVSYKTSMRDKTAYAKFLVADIMVELKIEHPRKWRGSFIVHEEWEKIQNHEHRS